MSDLRFVLIGAGYWGGYQLAAWGEVAGVRCIGVCDSLKAKADTLAKRFGEIATYTNPEEMLRRERPDFVDIVSPPDTHAALIRQAIEHRVSIICQKPLAPTLAEARAVAAECRDAGVKLLVHENWRWQAPIREVKRLLDTGAIGNVFRGRVQYSNNFPVFDNQPSLRHLERFILTDMGTHILDVARFLFGEVSHLFCVTRRIHPDIRGEDVASVLMKTKAGAAVSCEMSYASRLEHDRFPETLLLIEGSRGSIELSHDYWVRVTTTTGTHSHRHPPVRYSWADPGGDLVQSSMVPCLRDLLSELNGAGTAETTAGDNLKTLELVFGAYESAESGRVVCPEGVQ